MGSTIVNDLHLKLRELRLGEVKQLARGPTAGQWQNPLLTTVLWCLAAVDNIMNKFGFITLGKTDTDFVNRIVSENSFKSVWVCLLSFHVFINTRGAVTIWTVKLTSRGKVHFVSVWKWRWIICRSVWTTIRLLPPPLPHFSPAAPQAPLSALLFFF